MVDNYQIHRIDSTRLKDLQVLSRAVLGKEISMRFLQRKFSTQHTGKSYIGYIAYNETRNPVAYYGLYPCVIFFNGNKITGALSGDTMTHPDHQGKGLFVTLAKKTFELAKTEGITCAFGFPNQNSYAGSLKAGWTYNGEKTRLYTVHVKTFAFAKFFRKYPWTQFFYKNYSAIVLGFYKSSKKYFPNSVIEENTGGILHDENFFRYKNYTDNKIVKVAGVNVWVKINGELKIGDVERTDTVNFIQLLKSLKKLSSWLGCSSVSFLTTPETWLDDALSKHDPGQETFLVARINWAPEFPVEKIKFSAGDFDTF